MAKHQRNNNEATQAAKASGDAGKGFGRGKSNPIKYLVLFMGLGGLEEQESSSPFLEGSKTKSSLDSISILHNLSLVPTWPKYPP